MHRARSHRTRRRRDGRSRSSAWSAGDLSVLERANTPEMTSYLGGPETDDQLRERHARYLRLWRDRRGAHVPHRRRRRARRRHRLLAGRARRRRRVRGRLERRAAAWQGRGIAREALRQLIRRVADDGTPRRCSSPTRVWTTPPRTRCAAAPGSSTADRARRRGAAASSRSTSGCSTCRRSTSPGREPDVDERFDGRRARRVAVVAVLHAALGLARRRRAARWRVGERGLELRIDADTAPWAPELDGDLRVSHLQTGPASPVRVGTTIGQHRFREGSSCAKPSPSKRLWLARHGVIEVRLAAIRHPDAMVAFWPIGFEDRPTTAASCASPRSSGAELDADGGWVGVGVKPQNDPRLREDFEKIRVDGDLTAFHDYAVEWTPRPRAVLHRRSMGEDGRPGDRLPGPAHARRVRVPASDGSRDTAAAPARLPRWSGSARSRRADDRGARGALKQRRPGAARRLQLHAVPEAEQRVVRVERHVGAGCRDRGHRTRQVERQPALRLRPHR